MAFRGIAGDNTQIKLEGWDQFINSVKALSNDMKPKVIKDIIRKNMLPIAKTIKANTPIRKADQYQGTIVRKRKDGSTSTESSPGNLKKSIGVKTFGKGENITGYAGIQKRRNDGWYGFFIERGTKTMGKNPFIARSSAIATPAAANNLSKDVTDYIVKNARKLGLDAK
jgi:HK97 gp10 family phage protein